MSNPKNFMIFLIWLLKSIFVIVLGIILYFVLVAIGTVLVGDGGFMGWGIREKTAKFLSAFFVGGIVFLSIFFVFWLFPSISEDNIKAVCTQKLEKQFEYDFEWTNGWTSNWYSKTQNWGVKNDERIKLDANAPSSHIFSISYMGDKLRLQNKYGAWSNYIYECRYRKASGIHIPKIIRFFAKGNVISVEIKKGKL